MDDEQVRRALKVGGPLEGWRREVERRGEDPIRPVLDMLGAEGAETLMETLFNDLEERFKAWGPAQYIKGFPQEETPMRMLVEPHFDDEGLWVEASALLKVWPYSQKHVPQYIWTPTKGYNYNEEEIFRFLVLGPATSDLVTGQVWGHAWHDNMNQIRYHLHLQGPWGARRRDGLFERSKVFDFHHVQALINEILPRGVQNG